MRKERGCTKGSGMNWDLSKSMSSFLNAEFSLKFC